MNNEPVAWDRGTWTVGETESQEFIESSDFNHDVRLYLTGDFEDDTQRLNYLKHIADRLNTHPVKEQEMQAEIEALKDMLEEEGIGVSQKYLDERIAELGKAQEK